MLGKIHQPIGEGGEGFNETFFCVLETSYKMSPWMNKTKVTAKN